MTRSEIAEGIFTLLAIIALWPAVIGWNHPLYQAGLIVVLAVLAVLVVKKFRRIRKMYDETRPELKKRR